MVEKVLGGGERCVRPLIAAGLSTMPSALPVLRCAKNGPLSRSSRLPSVLPVTRV